MRAAGDPAAAPAEASWAAPLAGRRVLVVGGAGGSIGTAVTRAVGKAGPAHVVVADLRPEHAQAEVTALTEMGVAASALTCDVRVSGEMDRVVAAAGQAMGGIDVLITVVGGHGAFLPWQPTTATTDDQWQLSFALNVDYVFRVVRAALDRFVAQGTGGSIVSIGSVNGIRSSPMSVAYGSAKAALINLATTVAVEYGRHGVRMNMVSLGLVRTPQGDELDAANAADPPIARMSRTIPLGRPGLPGDVGNAVVFLASELSSYITGQNLIVDGGVTSRASLVYQGADPSMAG